MRVANWCRHWELRRHSCLKDAFPRIKAPALDSVWRFFILVELVGTQVRYQEEFMSHTFKTADELIVAEWINTAQPISLSELRGRVVVLHAFQMLCPGCVSHGIPQAIKIHNAFSRDDVVVLGLHTVFEHHAVMNAEALKVFLHEYKISFPVGIDTAQADHPIPLTMQAYELRGTPSMVLIDRNGSVRLSHLGQIDDLQLGAILGQLIAEAKTS
jgi:peroxiredoxin